MIGRELASLSGKGLFQTAFYVPNPSLFFFPCRSAKFCRGTGRGFMLTRRNFSSRRPMGLLSIRKQLMEIAGLLSDYSMDEANTLRKDIGKRIPEVMAQQRTRFLEGTKKNKIDQKGVIESILEARDKGDAFKSLIDYCKQKDLGKRK
jgi:hypothetical protein